MRYLAIGFGALLAVLFIMFFALTASRADGLPAGHGDCNGGVVSIEGSDDLVTYDAGTSIIDGVCLKAGNTQKHNQVYRNDGVILSSDGKQKCYVISGIGTSKVTVTREGKGRTCQGLSHIDVLVRRRISTPTPTPTVTPTSVPTSTPTATPTATGTPTPTPMGTPPEVTPIPTITPVAISSFDTPRAFPNTGGEPAGLPSAGVGAFVADGGSNYADTLKTVSILLVFIGLSALAFWALFRRG